MIKARKLRWIGHVARIKEGRSACNILTGKPIEKRALGRLRRIRGENIRMDLKEIGVNTRNWIDSGQDADYYPCECSIEPPGFMYNGVSYAAVSLFLNPAGLQAELEKINCYIS